MSYWKKPMVAAKSAVSAPTVATTVIAVGDSGEEEAEAGHHVDAGGDHGRGVDQGRDRRRAGHGVGEPDVERDLGALAGRADEDQHADEREQGHAPERLVAEVLAAPGTR